MKPLNLGLEAIQFQDGVFHKELTMAFEELQKLDAKEIPKSNILPRICKIVKHHTNMLVEIDVESGFGPAVAIPDINKNIPLLNEAFREYFGNVDGYRLLAKNDGSARARVDLRAGKVYGAFEDIIAMVYMPVDFIKKSKMTPEECSAVILHEFGHQFSYFEYLTRTTTTNQALSEVARALQEKAAPADREVILVNARKALRLKSLEDSVIKELAENKNPVVVESVLISNVLTQTRSEIGTDIYDINNWEYLADQYAARQGAGRELVTALDKLHRSRLFNSLEFRTTGGYYFVEAMKVVTLIAAVAAALTPIGSATTFIWAPLVGGILAMDNLDDGTYDRPQARLQRIRNSVVEALKDPSLPAKQKDGLRQDLVAIDDVLKDVTDRRALFTVVMGWISKSQRQRLSAAKLQQELEKLASNDLFLRAQELKDLAKH